MGVTHRPLEQSGPGEEGINEIRSALYQRLCRNWERLPQTAGVVSGNGSRRPLGFDVAGQQLQDLAKGQVGVADSGVLVAGPAGDQQIGMGRHGPLGKSVHQRRFAAAGAAGRTAGPRTRRGGLLESYLRTDTIPYPGFSGGPLVDAAGHVLEQREGPAVIDQVDPEGVLVDQDLVVFCPH